MSQSEDEQKSPIEKLVEAGLRAFAEEEKIPPAERFDRLVRAGIIDERGRVLHMDEGDRRAEESERLAEALALRVKPRDELTAEESERLGCLERQFMQNGNWRLLAQATVEATRQRVPSPGPWRWERKDGAHSLLDAESEDVVVATGYNSELAAGDADERLIASAPDLLAAVEQLADAVTWMSGASDFAPEGKAAEGWRKVREEQLKPAMELVRRVRGHDPEAQRRRDEIYGMIRAICDEGKPAPCPHCREVVSELLTTNPPKCPRCFHAVGKGTLDR